MTTPRPESTRLDGYEERRHRRDITALSMLTIGALIVLGAAFVANPLLGLGVAGLIIAAAGALIGMGE